MVTPQMLRWARHRAQFALEEVAVAAGVAPEKVASWEMGNSKPTLRQARKVANKLKIPFGYLYLFSPPNLNTPLPDFRKLPAANRATISPDLRELVQQTKRKQEWYREYLSGQGVKSLAFIGKFTVDDNPLEVARDIGDKIGINDDFRKQAKNYSEFVRLLTKACEREGITLLRTGIVGNNTRRPLNVREFRGFAISDPIAPLILINSKDALAAQIFTIIHELAHLWIDKSGISNLSNLHENNTVPNTEFSLVEIFCNQVAAETLVPKDAFTGYWNRLEEPTNQLQNIARRFWVSTIVILRRALDNQLISKKQFFELHKLETAKQTNVSKQSSGGDFYSTSWVRHSKQITRSIINATREGELLYRDAADLLGVRVETLSSLARELESS